MRERVAKLLFKPCEWIWGEKHFINEFEVKIISCMSLWREISKLSLRWNHFMHEFNVNLFQNLFWDVNVSIRVWSVRIFKVKIEVKSFQAWDCFENIAKLSLRWKMSEFEILVNVIAKMSLRCASFQTWVCVEYHFKIEFGMKNVSNWVKNDWNF